MNEQKREALFPASKATTYYGLTEADLRDIGKMIR